ncbi:MAG: hypothetical protein L0K47_11730, partial [Acidipropionibacterium jensenii]|nr:hypothetical protein [Acidipropionibacterium jensenii]
MSSPPGPVEDPLGLWELRCQIAEHLRQMRGLIATPDRVVVTAGAREGLATVLGTWATPDR